MMKLFRSGTHRADLTRIFVLGLLLGSVIVGVAAEQLWARPGEPSRDDHRISMLVASRMNLRHLSDMRVNDEISERTFTKFFDSLDPLKLFFLQSDIEEFSQYKNLLDDFISKGDLRVAKLVFDRFLHRVEEHIKVAQNYVDAEHDFTLDETMIRDPEKMAYAATEVEANDRWRKRVKFDLLTLLADEESPEDATSKLHKRYRGIRRNWEQTNNDELLELFLNAMTESFDPHSSYMSPSTLENFEIMMRLELNGIGASLESKLGDTIVRRIVPGGAADRDGRLKIDDVITGVAQQGESEFVDIVEMKINDVVKMIRGEPDTIVRLEVMPADGSGRTVYDITRARIELKDSEARGTVLERPELDPSTGAAAVDPIVNPPANVNPPDGLASGTPEAPNSRVVENPLVPGGKKQKIGVINLPSFYMDMDGRREGNPEFKSTTRDLRRILEDFNTQGVDLVVMDLRFNGGGSLPESVETTGLFIEQGPVVQVKGTDGRVIPYPDDDRSVAWSGPLVVVINRFSASASEIFAGAIQDYGRGIVVGDHATHGKGTVQQLEPLGPLVMPIRPPNYGALKMTIQQFYRPGGDSTQKRGVVSDVEIPYRTSFWEGISESDLDYALEFDRVRPAPHQNYNMVSPQILQELKSRSQTRVENSEYFVKERRKIDRYLEKQAQATVTLNREKFLAERAEVNADKDQEEVFESMQEEDRPVFAPTPYNEELTAIALDYLELLGENHLAVAR